MTTTWHALATTLIRDEPRAAIATEAGLYDLDLVARLLVPEEAALIAAIPRGVEALVTAWAQHGPGLATLAARLATAGPDRLTPLGTGIRLGAPYAPRRIFAAASNYREHAQEMGTVLAAKAESEPFIFIKADSSVIGPDDDIILPARVERLDWEVELAAVIGTGGRDIPAAGALAHVAAYTVLNDITSRDLTRRSDVPFKHDWFRGKSWDSFCPLGPWLVPAACLGDPQAMRLTLDVNGERMQDDSTEAMIFTLAEQIAYLSSILTLRPGDMIATGTPDGVGMGRGVYLKAGDHVLAAIEGIGAIGNTVRAA